MNRRTFLKTSATTATTFAALSPSAQAARGESPTLVPRPRPPGPVPALPDLQPARWVWYPSGRWLANTFVLFRRELTLPAKPKRATGWIAADSRYRLEVNGHRLQWGPAPADPRWPEADPVDLTAALVEGPNALGATVLFYGHGDGTWPLGKPGFLFWLEIEHADGRLERLGSDATWRVHRPRSWRLGQYKRWYLRALQEEFDARLHPHGWSTAAYQPGDDWLPAMELGGAPDKPALATNYYEYTLDVGSGPPDTALRPRSIPLLTESVVPVRRLAESLWLEWPRSVEDYFAFRVPGSFKEERIASATESAPGEWVVKLDGRRGAALTFELTEQVVGWPSFTVEAPAGTTVELLVHEAHQLGGPPLLNSHFDSWTRFICQAGVNEFETFDFESLRWLQLHLHGAAGEVKVRQVGVRRRQFPWPHPPEVKVDEPALQRLFEATVNTLHNCAQETIVDGMARERQQYSGDGAHQLHAIYLAFGETRLPARYLATFSQGLTKDGYFLDCWPAYDRLARLIERQFDLTGWGPILDHGVGFNFDCWHHYLYTGDLEALKEPYPRLLRFGRYLSSLRDAEGLLPVENLGIPSVWIDHAAYRQQRHKQCAFNLYAAAMFDRALAPLCRALGDSDNAAAAKTLGRQLLESTVRRFWNGGRGLFVVNQPWLAEEKEPRLCDRSLATSILFDQCPRGRVEPALRALANCPPYLGFSYPANAGWRLWALAKGGRPEAILKDLRTRWAGMESVKLNNTLQEDWDARPDSGQQWSHCAVVPLYILFMGLAGLRPLEPGFGRVEVRPQLADLKELDLTAWTVRGPIRLRARGGLGERELTLALPDGCPGELVLPATERVELSELDRNPALHRYALPAGQSTVVPLRYS